jgi:hypothetical protein
VAELVTLTELNTLTDAYLLKSKLEAAGIRTYITNENINTIFPMPGVAGIKLQVNLNDSFRAMDILYEEQEGENN